MRILFANHTSAWSGARGVPDAPARGLRSDHDVCVACPPRAPLPDAVDRAGVERVPFPTWRPACACTRSRPRSGWRSSAAGGLALGARCAALRGRRGPREHTACRASWPRSPGCAGAPPFVVRAHEHVPLTRVGRAVRGADRAQRRRRGGRLRLHGRRASTRGWPSRSRRASTTASTTRASTPPGRAGAPARGAGIGADAQLLGQVAQITPWKGQDTAIRALVAAARATGIDAHLLLVGQSRLRRQGRALRQPRLPAVARAAGRASWRCGDAVHFLGQREDVPDDPARAGPVAAALVGGAVRAGDRGEHGARHAAARERRRAPGPSWCEDGVTGRVLPPKRPDAWARAARELLERPRARCARMGERGPAAASPLPRRRARGARCWRVYAARGRRRRCRPGERAARWPSRGNRVEAPWLS